MLNLAKTLEQLEKSTQSLYAQRSQAYEDLCSGWQRLKHDEVLQAQIQAVDWPFIVPLWAKRIDSVFFIEPAPFTYTVLAVDGSQIYPDRHQGISCYLLNAGYALFSYDGQSSVILGSEPRVVVAESDVAPEVVNAQRTAYELKMAVHLIKRHDVEGQACLFLFDGSLIFWHLDMFSGSESHDFLKRYLRCLHMLYETRCIHAGYISMPKSREVVNCVRAAELLRLGRGNDAGYTYSSLVDADIIATFLGPGFRTQFFENRSHIVSEYAAELRPYFCYYNNGSEIVRIEVPAWIAAEDNACESLVSLIADQCAKGRGYPVCLAEAHEQAVVQGQDRDMFYHLVQKCTQAQEHRYRVSHKSLHKRRPEF